MSIQCPDQQMKKKYKCIKPILSKPIAIKDIAKFNFIHYVINLGKPQQNGKVKRSHRENQEK